MTGQAPVLRSALLAGFVVGLTACGAAAGSPGSSGAVADLGGLWGVQDTEGTASLALDDDGTATGTDGCNRMLGTWEQDGTQVAFGPWAVTRMACPSVDTWLSLSVKATLEGENLVFVGPEGVVVGTLQRNS
ncbi:META domain-containing protein [Cellulomonas fengjieae]|uniref:META domain-containing protein n=1 Tax=Cellulomonas fengjieae TaxID=2819978 RepID=UPI0020C0320F|nr:META domain-containing protein [Cellulomonas fengjieae]